MPLIVLPITPSDIRSVYDVYFSAFEGDIMLEILFPMAFEGGKITEEFRAGHAIHQLEYLKSTPFEHTLKCVGTDANEIVGMAVYGVYFKERPYEEYKSPSSCEWLKGKERERCEQLLVPLWRKKEELLEGRPHVYCQVLAVDPKHQKQGIGALLMQWGIDIAEKLRVPIYLESTLAAVRLYEKIGFTRVGKSIAQKPEVTGLDYDIEVPLFYKMPKHDTAWKFERLVGERPSNSNGTEPEERVLV